MAKVDFSAVRHPPPKRRGNLPWDSPDANPTRDVWVHAYIAQYRVTREQALQMLDDESPYGDPNGYVVSDY